MIYYYTLVNNGVKTKAIPENKYLRYCTPATTSYFMKFYFVK